MNRAFKLFRLQQIDTQLDRLRSRLEIINNLLNDDSVIRQSKECLAEISTKLELAKKHLHRAEQDVQAHLIKIEMTESALYGGKIHNPKELQDLVKEAEALKRYLGVLEERQLEAMLEYEEIESEHSKALMNEQIVLDQVKLQNAALTEEQSGLLKELSHQEAERQAAINNIQAEDLQLYLTIRPQRGGIAVAKVVDYACSACGTTLSAALLQAAKSPQLITRCTTCDRILYAL